MLQGRLHLADDGQDHLALRPAQGAASVSLTPEAEELVPGLPQRVLLKVADGAGRPVKGSRFRLEGDGLALEVSIDDVGAAEATWQVPADVVGQRKVGPCSGGVAATLVLRKLSGPDDLPATTSACVRVDREARLLVKPEQLLARAGDEVRVEVAARALGRDPAPSGPLGLLLDDERGSAATVWAAGPDKAASTNDVSVFKASIKVPPGPGGALRITAIVPREAGGALLGAARIVAKPAVLPAVQAKLAGGRAVPGGKVAVDVTLADEAGKGLPGSITAIVFDASGDDRSLFHSLDTRTSICAAAGFDKEACPAVLAGARAAEVRANPSAGRASARSPERDPAGTADAEMRETFASVMKSLEGAVFEASNEADGVADVLRKSPRGNQFNPELFRIVTDAMGAAPTTPGAEPVVLADLAAVDPQVTYDKVARRVARLELSRLRSQARTFRHENDLDPDEPALSDPNALLRRWSADGMEGALRDPWGGTFTFVPNRGEPRPFLTAMPGFDLVGPGPDGRVGTGDDVRDRFERVLASKTPYAVALAEDCIVDAPLDLRVADSTIAAWSELLEASTGTALGGTGQGFGSGPGRLGGSHRSKPPQVRMGATRVTRGQAFGSWVAPVRTDANGRARIEVPLGGDETTYRVVVIAMPDSAGPALASVDVPIALPLSARIRAGD